jgi:hypothetical protein
MASASSCPAEFQPGVWGSTCHYICPSDFVNVQDGSRSKCRLLSDPTKEVTLNLVWRGAGATRFGREKDRLAGEFEKIRFQSADRKTLQASAGKSEEWVKRYDALESRYADFQEANEALESTTSALKARRPPTAPTDDLSEARSLVMYGPKVDILLVQVALFLAVLSILGFLIFPREVAQGVAFLLLCTGVAVGFFLRK